MQIHENNANQLYQKFMIPNEGALGKLSKKNSKLYLFSMHFK